MIIDFIAIAIIVYVCLLLIVGAWVLMAPEGITDNDEM